MKYLILLVLLAGCSDPKPDEGSKIFEDSIRSHNEAMQSLNNTITETLVIRPTKCEK